MKCKMYCNYQNNELTQRNYLIFATYSKTIEFYHYETLIWIPLRMNYSRIEKDRIAFLEYNPNYLISHERKFSTWLYRKKPQLDIWNNWCFTGKTLMKLKYILENFIFYNMYLIFYKRVNIRSEVKWLRV